MPACSMRTLVRRGEFVADARLRRALPLIVLASLIMGAALWLAAAACSQPWFAPQRTGSCARAGPGRAGRRGPRSSMPSRSLALGVIDLRQLRALLRRDRPPAGLTA